MASNSLAYYAVIFHHHHHSYHIIFPQESHDLMGFYSVQGVICPMPNLNLEDQGTVHILASYLWLDQPGGKPMALLWCQSSHTGLRIMQAWPPQQGDKLWVLRLKRQSILGESYYLPPQNTTNKVLKALKTERLWLEKKSLWIHFSQSHLLGISYRKDKEFWFLPKIAGYFVTSLAVTVLLSTRSPGIQSLAASLVPSRTGIHTKGVRLTVYNIVYDTNEHHKN